MVEQAQADAFLNALRKMRGSAGNGKLRQALNWDEVTYNAVKHDLLATGAIEAGRGRGGSVALVDRTNRAMIAEILRKNPPPGFSSPGEAENSATADEKLADQPTSPRRGRATPVKSNGGNLGFEAELFKTADKLRGNMEPSDYKHVALGLIFLKHISDSFEAKRAELLADYPDGAEDPDEYAAENVFWVPKEARWSHLRASARQLDRQADRRGDAGDREAQREPQRRLAEGLCAACTERGDARRVNRSDLRHRAWRGARRGA